MTPPKVPFIEVGPHLMQTTVNAARDLCGVRHVYGLQVLVADGQASICSHNMDTAGLVAMLEAVLERFKQGDLEVRPAVDGEFVEPPPGVKPS